MLFIWILKKTGFWKKWNLDDSAVELYEDEKGETVVRADSFMRSIFVGDLVSFESVFWGIVLFILAATVWPGGADAFFLWFLSIPIWVPAILIAVAILALVYLDRIESWFKKRRH